LRVIELGAPARGLASQINACVEELLGGLGAPVSPVTSYVEAPVMLLAGEKASGESEEHAALVGSELGDGVQQRNIIRV
jgi:hypothetical protein